MTYQSIIEKAPMLNKEHCSDRWHRSGLSIFSILPAANKKKPFMKTEKPPTSGAEVSIEVDVVSKFRKSTVFHSSLKTIWICVTSQKFRKSSFFFYRRRENVQIVCGRSTSFLKPFASTNPTFGGIKMTCLSLTSPQHLSTSSIIAFHDDDKALVHLTDATIC